MFKERAIKRYARKLPPLLKKRYGASNFYTRGQVEQTVILAKLGEKHIIYAYALFCAESELDHDIDLKDHFHKLKEYFATTYFGGDSGFTVAAVTMVMAGGFFADTFGGSDGGGFGDGGGGGDG